jgi:hypothetical protein
MFYPVKTRFCPVKTMFYPLGWVKLVLPGFLPTLVVNRSTQTIPNFRRRDSLASCNQNPQKQEQNYLVLILTKNIVQQ